jgi:hypothetical protein
MFNNSASVAEIYTLAEIYTEAGNEQLSINGLNTIPYNTEMPLGFTTLSSGTYSLKASQFSNFENGAQIFLKDYLDINNPVVTDLSDGNSYSFTSVATTNNTSRFALVFKAPSISTGFTPAENTNLWISINGNQQIVVNGNVNNDGKLAVFSTIGQKLIEKNLSLGTTILEPLHTGVYLVTVTVSGKSITRKVIID